MRIFDTRYALSQNALRSDVGIPHNDQPTFKRPLKNSIPSRDIDTQYVAQGIRTKKDSSTIIDEKCLVACKFPIRYLLYMLEVK